VKQVINRPHLTVKVHARPLSVENAPTAVQGYEDIVAEYPQTRDSYDRHGDTHREEQDNR
jgi:hypothetical protein